MPIKLILVLGILTFLTLINLAGLLIIISLMKGLKESNSCIRLLIGEVDCLWNPCFGSVFEHSLINTLVRWFRRPYFHIFLREEDGECQAICGLKFAKLLFQKGTVVIPQRLGHRLCRGCEALIDTCSDLRELDHIEP